jgi:hypothetical protein
MSDGFLARSSVHADWFPDDARAADAAFTAAIHAAALKLGCDGCGYGAPLLEILEALEPLDREDSPYNGCFWEIVRDVLDYVQKDMSGTQGDSHEIVGLIALAIDCRFGWRNGFLTILDLLKLICNADELVAFRSDLDRVISQAQSNPSGGTSKPSACCLHTRPASKEPANEK